MQKKIKKFHQVLYDDNIKLDDIELVEALWLAEQISKRSATNKNRWFEQISLKMQNIYDALKNKFASKDNLQKEEQTTKDEDIKNFNLKHKKRKKKKSNNAPLVASDDGEKKSLPFRTPVNRYIDNDNSWIYALRHFRRKRPSLHRFIFDEEKTADYIASTKIFNPQFRPKYEKCFEAIFVVDISNSMEIWQELIDEFFKSIKNYAIFKSVTIYYMDTELPEVVLYRSRDKRVKLRENRFLNLSDEVTIFIMSDMYAKSWFDNNFLEMLYKWQKRVPVSIVQMLSYRLWKATLLNHSTLTKLSGRKVFAKNRYLKSRTRIKKEDKVMKIPLLNLNTTSFDAYGRVMSAKSNNRIDGAIFKLDKKKEKRVSEVDKKLSSEERVENFYKTASESAKKLAEYFSVIPLSFPIMKILQQELLPKSTQVHLSEVFMSGLINKQVNNGIYSFYNNLEGDECVREILLKMLGTSKAIDTIINISTFVNAREGAFDFLAFLKNPSLIEKSSEFNEIDREFAQISAKILQNMGGEYAKLAETLIEYIDEYEYEEEYETIFKIPTSKRFQMGSEDGEDREKPIHEVIINYDFEISKYPVTVAEFRVFVKDMDYKTEAERDDGSWIWDEKKKESIKKKDVYWDNPYFEQSEDNPVVCISWNDAVEYCKWLSEKTGEEYRLPTEAEWEYSCRGGTTTKWSFGDDEKELKEYAWYTKNSGKKTHSVGEKKKNPWDIYDMNGNIWEWCEDDFVDNYEETPRDGSANTKGEQKYKVLRGGSWYDVADRTRSAIRVWVSPAYRSDIVGFRLLRTLPS